MIYTIPKGVEYTLLSLQEMLIESLSLYPIEDPKIEFIRHNENATYRITDGNSQKQYVIRIHTPTEGFSLGLFGTARHSICSLQNELDIIEAIRRNAGLPLQKPVASKSGNMVSSLSDLTPVTLLQWVDGVTIESLDIGVDILNKIGEMIAKIHKSFIDTPTQQNYDRFNYDQSLLPKIANAIQTAVQKKYIESDQSKLILTTLIEIEKRMDELENYPDSKGVVHSDLSKSNMILSNKQIIPIDFCLCGYSFFYMDLGSLMGHFTKPDQRKLILDGYQHVMKREIELRLIEPFLAMQVLMFIACQYEKVPQWEWFSKAMDRWCNTIFMPLIRKTSFLCVE